MNDFTVRQYTAADVPALAALWQRTFGDSAELTDAFYRLLPDMGVGFAAVSGDKLVGEAHLITDLELISGGVRKGLAYLYAVAVDESCRGNGIGAALVSSAEMYARENGFIFCTEPAEPGLYAWYARISGLKHELCRGKMTIPAAEGRLSRISAADYLSRRDAIVGRRDTVRAGLAATEFEESVCRIYGGGLYASDEGIAAAYPDNGVLKVCELIGDTSAVSAAAFSLGLQTAECCVLSQSGTPYLASDTVFPLGLFWQMTFD